MTCTLASAGTPITLFAADSATTTGNDQALLDDCVRFGGAGTISLSPLPAGDDLIYTIAVAPDEALDPAGRTTRVEVLGSSFQPLGVTGGFNGTYASGSTHAVHRVTLDGAAPLVISVQGTFGIESANGVQVVPSGANPINGANFCIANTNSTGAFGTMGAIGQSLVVANDFTLLADSLPPGVFGVFVVSRTAGGNVLVNQGNLCLTGPTGRFQGPGQIFQADAAGSASLMVDLRVLPTPLGVVPVLPGGTWYFQAWHRDAPPSPGHPGSNFTEGVSVTFI